MGKLEKMCSYLSGPMDRAPDGGENWREKAQKELWAMGIGVFNPCQKPTLDFVEDANFRANLQDYKENGNYGLVKEEMRKIIGCDLRMLDLSSFMIMYVHPDIYSCGTFWECCYAVQQHKPILVWCDAGVEHVPNWLFGLISSDYMFSSWETLLGYLKKIDDGTAPTPAKQWKFFDYDKIFGRNQ